ncbi:hypothetical protein BOX37_11600 [Nocardia mangyaensis]|uniref:DUF4333 domain-containing protein n=1 Tax=Nocardia mangyaensis TaxID=2213200 RepID=A0A1J0VR34_9NOCA|nr:DUF4333 domain-containing protein [Nocardia mangyaensis]APE34492.1 hypothetical protein BOX37_11600 [Nocardia mangyaensis]
MSGPYGPNGPGEGSNDPTQHWGGQQGAGGAGPTQHWGGAAQPPQGGQPPQQAQPTQHWGDPNAQQPPQQWGQPQQPGQQPQWGQQPPQGVPPQPTGPQQQWGQTQPPPQDWNAQGANAQQQWGGQPPQQQWGQQPQQQWGQQLQPQPSGGKGKGLVIGLVVAGVLVVAAIIGLLLVLFASDELDQSAVQDGVSRVLVESYGIADVSDVSCPSGQEVKVDATFTCDLKVSGEDKQVTIKVTKDDGTYEVGRPN